MKKRKVYSGEVHHVFQRSQDRGVIFYSVHDYLVFYTTFCSQARMKSVEVLALCPMLDHIHLLAVAKNQDHLAGFIQSYSHLFAWEWNKKRKKKGSLFWHRYGSAAKVGNKQVRTALAYCNNNPVERKLTEHAEDYRWTFLSYYHHPAPYSLALNPSHARSYMRLVLKEVKACFESSQYLRYSQLERWEKNLSPQEWFQLVDYIIGLWNVIDYEQAISYYGSHQAMIRAFHDNTGSEYDIKEDRDNYSDAVYADCSRILLSAGLIDHLWEIPTLPEDRKRELYDYLQPRTSARPKQLRKYLHFAPDLNI